jgi:nitroimidazol reductase NimA-like FMN-containing flavoprotein (pyridoxamine 5'-phosphate oxidase superfamily)
MEQPALRILHDHRIMSISTLREDGWPQTTVVGYANKGFDLFFMIFRNSQKFANIKRDNRISVAIASEPPGLDELTAVYASARAVEITDAHGMQEAWRLLMERHSNLAGFNMPHAKDAAFMRARCEVVSVLDYRQGPGHHEQLTINDQGIPASVDLRRERWGEKFSAVEA